MQHAERTGARETFKAHIRYYSRRISVLQCTDEALQCVCKAADKYPAKEGVGL